MIDLNVYQNQARSTAVYLNKQNSEMIYPAMGLIGECGEVAEKIKKMIRDDDWEIPPERRQAILKELGDVMWYCANICCDTDNNLQIIYEMRGHLVTQEIKSLPLIRKVIHMNACAVQAAKELEEWYYFHERSMSFQSRHMSIPPCLARIIVCVSQIAELLGYTLEYVCKNNIAKLAGREQRGTLNGEGDDR